MNYDEHMKNVRGLVEALDTVGIVGFGVVGQAVASAFRLAKFKIKNFDIDPEKSNYSLREVVTESHLIIVCVPTPNNPDGSINLCHVLDVLKNIDEFLKWPKHYNPVVLIKSTVTPGTTEALHKLYPEMRLGVYPEFLRQLTAKVDARNPSRVVVGLCNSEDEEHVRAYIELLKPELVFFTTPTNAELIKMLSNAFLSLKVGYANLIEALCEVYGGDSDVVYTGIVADPRIADSHLAPVGGKMPADGPCLPKDLSALIDDIQLHYNQTPDVMFSIVLLRAAHYLAVDAKTFKQ